MLSKINHEKIQSKLTNDVKEIKKHDKAIKVIKASVRQNSQRIDSNEKANKKEIQDRTKADKKVLREAKKYTDKETSEAIKQATDKNPSIWDNIGSQIFQ